jgi:hypothetical protein
VRNRRITAPVSAAKIGVMAAHGNELGAFLRANRARVEPAEAGFAGGVN